MDFGYRQPLFYTDYRRVAAGGAWCLTPPPVIAGSWLTCTSCILRVVDASTYVSGPGSDTDQDWKVYSAVLPRLN